MKLIVDAIQRSPVYLNSTPFYRRHPRPSRTRLSWIDARGAIDFETGLFYSRIPKAANSYVLQEMFRLRTSQAFPAEVIKKKFRRPSQLTEGELSKFNELFKFTIVRNPYSRTLSAFLDKVKSRNLIIPEISKNSSPSFIQFCRYLSDGGLHKNIHWAPQTSIILLPYSEFDYVGRVETLHVDLPVILDQGRDISSAKKDVDTLRALVEPSARSPKADGLTSEYYDDESRNIVARIFTEDLEVLGYPRM